MRRQNEDTGAPQLASTLGVDSAEGPESLSRKELLASKHSIPLFAYALLLAAIFAVSSAGVVFKKLESDVLPITAAAWRLQATSILLLPMFIAQWRDTTDSIRQDWWKAWPLMSASGLALAVHFCTWVFGLARTSLPHALLFVTSTPILIAAGCVVLGLPITRGEVASAVVGFLGMVLCEVATSSSKDKATLVGDIFSLMGAIAIIGYLHVGRKLREWMPIFLYALPVTAVSAVLATVTAMLLEGAALLQTGPEGAFGYFDRKHFGWVLYLACGPGIVGHTGFNTLLRFFPPLVISMAFPLEPIVGSIMGAAAGISELPGLLTWIGGGIMVSALIACTWQQGRQDAQEEKRKAVTLATKQALADDALVEMSAFSIVEEEDFSIDES